MGCRVQIGKKKDLAHKACRNGANKLLFPLVLPSLWEVQVRVHQWSTFPIKVVHTFPYGSLQIVLMTRIIIVLAKDTIATASASALARHISEIEIDDIAFALAGELQPPTQALLRGFWKFILERRI